MYIPHTISKKFNNSLFGVIVENKILNIEMNDKLTISPIVILNNLIYNLKY